MAGENLVDSTPRGRVDSIFRLSGIQILVYWDAMKTTIDIPDDTLEDAMRFTGARTKREAVVKALTEFNRMRKVRAILAVAGSFPDFRTNEEIEAVEIERQQKLGKSWARAKNQS
jgi:Arc/MetJ family transcription regulator